MCKKKKEKKKRGVGVGVAVGGCDPHSVCCMGLAAHIQYENQCLCITQSAPQLLIIRICVGYFCLDLSHMKT